MEATDHRDPPEQRTTDPDTAAVAPSPVDQAGNSASPQTGVPCRACSSAAGSAADDAGATAARYVYALGRIEARFPNLAAEKEFAQAGGRTDTVGKTDQETFHAVLSERDNRYLVRQLC